MTWEQFYLQVIKKFSYQSPWNKNIGWYDGNDENYKVTWRTGGMSGGSCWGTEPSPCFYSEPPKELTLLDEFLEELCPAMTIFQYKRVLNSVVENGSYTVYEYYGNCDNMAFKSVNYFKLYESLTGEGLI